MRNPSKQNQKNKVMIKIFWNIGIMDENIDVLKQRLSKAVEIFNEQKQTIKVLEDTITDLKLKNNELKNSYDLSVEENKKLKLELEKLSKDPCVNVDTATSALKKQKENHQNISTNTNYGNIFAPTPGNITI